MVNIFEEIREYEKLKERKAVIKTMKQKTKYILKNINHVDNDDIEKIEYMYKKISRNKDINGINSGDNRNYLLNVAEQVEKSKKINNIVSGISDFLKENDILITSLNGMELIELLHNESNKIMDNIDSRLDYVKEHLNEN